MSLQSVSAQYRTLTGQGPVAEPKKKKAPPAAKVEEAPVQPEVTPADEAE